MAASERTLADVTVEFISSEKVKVNDDVTFKEIYSSILAKPENVTLISSESAESSVQPADQGQEAGSATTQAKYVVTDNPYTKGHSLFLIDRMMSCTPIAPYWEIFPTVYIGYEATDTTYTNKLYGHCVQPGGQPSIIPRQVASDAVFSNTWNALDQGYNEMFGIKNPAGIYKFVGAGDFVSVAPQIMSTFSLKINQPFAVYMCIHDYNLPQKMFLKDQYSKYNVNLDSPDALNDVSGTFGAVATAKDRFAGGTDTLADRQTLATHYDVPLDSETNEPDAESLSTAISSEDSRNNPTGQDDPLKGRVAVSTNYLEPAVDIKWGGYILTFYKNGQIRLLKGDKQVGDLKTLASDGDSADGGATFTRIIYPIADSIYVFAGDSTNYSSLSGKFVRFDIGSVVNIPLTKIITAFRCGAATFEYSHVIHPYPGTLISPPLGTGIAPDTTLVNVHYLGKFGSGNRSPAGASGSISFPDINDKNKKYAFLQGCTIVWKLKNIGTGQYIFSITLNPNIIPALGTNQRDFLISAIGCIYSPAVYLTQITLKQALDTISYGNNALDACDVMQVSVNQAVEANSASITLNNRDDSVACTSVRGGKYTHHEGQDGYAGIKPIKIDMKYTGGVTYRVFTGYVTNWKPARSSPSQSTITLECEDRTKKLKEQYAINLPFFDGWCVLGAIYYLCKQAGFDDDEILLQQDPRSGAKTTIRSLIQGDPETFTGGCFDGHVNTNLAPQQAGYSSSFLHMRLPMALMMAKESPAYAFQTGSSLWQCLSSIRDFTQWYLYANNWGNIIFGPPKSVVKNSGITFKEVDNCNSFYEYVRGLSVDFNTTDTRNMVYAQGLTWIGPRIGEAGWDKGQWVPHVHIARKAGWPNDTNDHSHAPWKRVTFMRDSKWEDVRLLRMAASEILRHPCSGG
jgi:hypothetical protein